MEREAFAGGKPATSQASATARSSSGSELPPQRAGAYAALAAEEGIVPHMHRGQGAAHGTVAAVKPEPLVKAESLALRAPKRPRLEGAMPPEPKRAALEVETAPKRELGGDHKAAKLAKAGKSAKTDDLAEADALPIGPGQLEAEAEAEPLLVDLGAPAETTLGCRAGHPRAGCPRCSADAAAAAAAALDPLPQATRAALDNLYRVMSESASVPCVAGPALVPGSVLPAAADRPTPSPGRSDCSTSPRDCGPVEVPASPLQLADVTPVPQLCQAHSKQLAVLVSAQCRGEAVLQLAAAFLCARHPAHVGVESFGGVLVVVVWPFRVVPRGAEAAAAERASRAASAAGGAAARRKRGPPRSEAWDRLSGAVEWTRGRGTRRDRPVFRCPLPGCEGVTSTRNPARHLLSASHLNVTRVCACGYLQAGCDEPMRLHCLACPRPWRPAQQR